MKAALTPPALQQGAEIDIEPFTGHTASGNVILLAIGIRYGVMTSWGHVHTQHRAHVHDETM
jgi:hypothetical protein